MTGGAETHLSNMTLDDDDDGELEEEEILVHVEFDCEVDPNLLTNDSTFKLIGVDSETPVMQLGSKVYQGEWRDIVGTSVFFEDDEEKKAKQSNADTLFGKVIDKPLKLACCTRKSLIMSRVFAKPKTDDSQQPSTSEDRIDNVIETNEVEGSQKQEEVPTEQTDVT